MRTTSSVRALSCLLVVGFVFTHAVQAATFNWVGNGTTGFNDPLNWDTNPTPPPSNTATDLVFDNNTNTGTVGTPLTANGNPMIINSITYGTNAGTFVIGGGNRFSLDNGIVVTQNSSSDQQINNEIRGSALGTQNLTLAGDGTGIVTINGLLANGTSILAINKTGSSTYVLNRTSASPNTTTGAITISGGVLQANNREGLGVVNLLGLNDGVLNLRGGVLQSNGSGSVLFSRAIGTSGTVGTGQVNWGAGGGGFSAGGGGTLTVRLGNGTTASTWGTTASYLGNGTALILNSNTATGMVDWQNGINLGSSTATQRVITVNDNSNLTTDFARISGVISSTTAGNSLLKNGPGRLELTGLNTFAGQLEVGVGTVAVLSTGSLSGSVKVNSGARFDVSDFNGGGGFTFSGGRTLSGNGNVLGKVNINTTGAIAPGSSVGSISTQSQDWGPGGVYNIEINDATGSAGSGFDQVQMTGSLTISSSSGGNEFKIKVASLTGATPGDAANFDPNQTYSWIIATTTDGISPGFDATAFSVDPAAFTNDRSGSQGTGFFVTSDGNNIILNYDGVPEPTAFTLLQLIALHTLTRRPRRRSLN